MQRIIFCLRVTNTKHDIAQNTKTAGNTGINKYGKYKALRLLFIRTYFRSKSNKFKASKLKLYFHKWKELTSDKEILQNLN